jgi:hypothetical protein
MLKFALLIPAVLFLAFGTEGLYNAARGRTQATVSCAQLRQAPPPSLSLRVTGCDIDYKGGAYREAGGSIEELFLPARPTGAPVNQPAPLVVATRVPNALAVAQPLVKSGPGAPVARSIQTMHDAATAAGISGEIRGLVRAGLLERLASQQVLSGLSTPLAADVILLDLNGSPSMAWPIVLIGLGLATLAALGHLIRRAPSPPAPVVTDSTDRETVLERLMPYAAQISEEPVALEPEPAPISSAPISPAPAVPAPVPPALVAPPPVASAPMTIAPVPPLFVVPEGVEAHGDGDLDDVPLIKVPLTGPPAPAVRASSDDNHVRLPRVMLLKLDSAAGPEAIEAAPPLGSKTDVTALLREVFPDLEIDQAGRGAHEGPDHALAVDLGRDDTVYTAILDARGQTGITALRWVLETTGWRAFVPKAGRFVEADALEDLAIRDATS